jgi:hypothetical protein
MYWNEDDIQPVVNTAVEIFGKPAQYQPEPFVYISIETPRFGTIWYGDVNGDINSVTEKATVLMSKLGEKVIVRDLGTSKEIISI